MVEELIISMKRWLALPGHSKAELARMAGLHRNTLLGCDRPDWNPTLDVIRKVEAVVTHPAQGAPA